MKKSLIAVAVAAALPAAAFAQSNVTLYGIGDVNIQFQNDVANGTNGQAQSGSSLGMGNGGQSGSRWGVRGEEDLGGGLAATFQFESAIGADDGTGNDQFARQSRVGLKGGFGELRFGRQYTPIFWTSIGYDQTGFGLQNNHVAIAGSAVRWSNSIEYRNNFGPLRLIVGASLDEANPGDQNHQLGLGLNYNAGSWGVGFGYHDESTAAQDETIIHLGGEVKLGSLAIGLNYGQSDLGNAGGAGDRTDIDLSFGLKVGAAGMIFLNVLNKEVEGGNDQMDIGLSYTHNMSKRTNWYATYGMDRIDNQEDPTTLQVGIRHKF